MNKRPTPDERKKRGRPRKYPFQLIKDGARTAARTNPFEKLRGKLSDTDRATLVDLLRGRATGAWEPTVVLVQAWLTRLKPLALPALTVDQRAWFAAAADALESRDDDQAAHYLV